MGGSVALPLVVEVAFGAEPLDTGTLTWTDISAYVKRSAGIDFSRGWDTEAAEPLAGRLTFTVNNDDGRFTPGETGAFGEVRNRLPVRVSRSGVGVLWTGLVESWRQSWENGVRSQVAVTCVDRWAAIRRLRLAADRVGLAAKSFAADYFYPFTDPDTSWREVSDLWPPIEKTLATAPMAFRVLEHPTDPAKSVGRISADGLTASYTYQTGVKSDQWSLDDGVTLAVVVKPETGLPNTNDAITWGIHWGTTPFMQVGITKHSSGDLRAAGQVYDGSTNKSVVGTTALSSAAWHVVVLTLKRVSTTVTLTVYADGVQHVTDTVVLASDLPASNYYMRINPNVADPSTADAGVGGAFALRRDLSAADAAALSSLLAQWAGDTADDRAALLVKFADPAPSLSTTGTFTSTMSKQDLTDKSLGDALLECATAERGTIYMSRDGWPVLTSRSWRVASAVAFTIPAKALAADVTFTLDDQQLTNSATVDRMVGEDVAGSTTARNETSVATYGEQNKSLQVWVDTDAQLLERANAEANIDAVAQPRSSDLMVDILSKNATIAAATLLGADIGQRIAVSGMPATAPDQDEFYIDSIADRVTHTGWERTFTVSTRADYWTLQDATYGQLDNVFVLAF